MLCHPHDGADNQNIDRCSHYLVISDKRSALWLTNYLERTAIWISWNFNDAKRADVLSGKSALCGKTGDYHQSQLRDMHDVDSDL